MSIALGAATQVVYDLWKSGKTQKEIAAETGRCQQNVSLHLELCRKAGIDIPKQSRRNRTANVKKENKLPANMPSRHIPRCPDCRLMLSNEGTCIDCPADSRRMLVLLRTQRSLSGSLSEIRDQAIANGRDPVLADFKAGLKRFMDKYPMSKEKR